MLSCHLPINIAYKLEQNRKIKTKKVIHFERAAADLVSNPTINVSIGTKMPPPPIPPTVPNADPKKPITVANTILQLNFNSCDINQYPITKYGLSLRHKS